jgi:hypothetical protein
VKKITSTTGCTYIVGWYCHATIFMGARLLPVEKRIFEIPRGPGGMGSVCKEDGKL